MENINNYMPLSNDLNKERLEILKKIFPDLFTNEGKLNIDELKKVVDPKSVSETERYEFRWFGKSQAKRNAFTPSNATLIYDDTRSLNPTESENLIIEGENLEVLKLLSGSYREKIKCIYIDPPYNTGKDFVYSDNFSQDRKAYWEDAGVIEDGLKIDTNAETDGRYHSNWLNMMYSRLLIARQLLKEDGVIFISIDDNEVHHLRKLCDEVFGEENFVANFIWQHRKSSQNDVDVSLSHNYTLTYAKQRDIFKLNPLGINEDKFSNLDNDPNGDWVADPMDAPGIRENLSYEITNPSTSEIFLPPNGRHWRFTKEKFEEALKENRIIFGKTGKSRPQYKRYKFEALNRGTNPFTIWSDMGTATEATQELMQIFEGEKYFDTPKPTKLLKEVFKLSSSDGDFILDFFGGSGTTGQAIIELNKEDGGSRKFILVQIPETTDKKSEAYKAGFKKISDITIERNKRIVEKIIKEKKNQQPDLFTNEYKENAIKGLGFKVFRLVKSNFPRVEFAPDPEKTDEENIELLKKYISDKESQLVTAFNRDELLTEMLLKKGFNLNYKTEKQEQFKKNEIYLATDGEKETLICLDIIIEMETVEYFKKHTDKKFICLERALDTTKKYNLKHYMGDMFNAF